jgi:hypothetical protein
MFKVMLNLIFSKKKNKERVLICWIFFFLCMIRFPTTASQVALAIQMGGGGGYYFLLFIVPLNPFGIQFMSKNRLEVYINNDLKK